LESTRGSRTPDTASSPAAAGAWLHSTEESCTPARLTASSSALTELLAEHSPTAVALETLYFGRNVRTAFAVGQARGVAMLCAGQHGVECFSYSPQQVKGAVCGNGRAPKDQVARMVTALLALSEVPRADHASDALAVAICHANHAPFAQSVAAAGVAP
jgi:crossover junction endodeoxyribonuclease RuvC